MSAFLGVWLYTIMSVRKWSCLGIFVLRTLFQLLVYVMVTTVSQRTFQCWWNCPCLDRSPRYKLSYRHLHVVYWFTNKEEYYNVRYEKCSASIFKSCEGKPPNISQPNWHGNAWHEEFNSVWPLLSFWAVRILCNTFCPSL